VFYRIVLVLDSVIFKNELFTHYLSSFILINFEETQSKPLSHSYKKPLTIRSWERTFY